MDVSSFLFYGALGVIVVYLIIIYNQLVALKHNVSKSWSNIDVLLKQRHEELPKLVETCKQYMKHERETLDQVMRARSGVSAARESSDIAALGIAETQLRQGLMNLFAVAEAYPDLKANESFRTCKTAFPHSKTVSPTAASSITRASTITTCVSNNFPTSSSPVCSSSRTLNYSNSTKKKPKTST